MKITEGRIFKRQAINKQNQRNGREAKIKRLNYQLTSFGELQDTVPSFFSERQASAIQSENVSSD